MRIRARALFLAGGMLSLAVGATPALATGLGSAPAPAAGKTWTIEPGGTFRIRPASVFVTDTATGARLTCVFTVFVGLLPSGSGLSSHFANLGPGNSFPLCYLPDGLGFAGSLTGAVYGVFYNASLGVTTGRLAHLTVSLAGSGCFAVLDGTAFGARDGIVRFTYRNSDASLTAGASGGNLHFYNVQGCQGLLDVADGDPATITFSGVVTPAQTITRP